MMKEAQAAAAILGRQIERLAASTNREIDAAFASLAQKQVEALVVTPSPLFYNLRAQLAVLAARHAVPAMYIDRDFVVAGGLMSYGPNTEDQYRQVGNYVGRILNGEKPADLPVARATKFEFVINLNTARALDLTIPPTLLALTDEVIE
jgi:putative ABC transport system substrate-binding protein